MGFDVSERQSEVVLSAKDGKGQVHEVVHVFRSPEKSELIKFERLLPNYEIKRNKPKKIGSRTEAMLWLWEQVIMRVVGYEFQGEDLMSQNNWKTFVPLTHRTAAVEAWDEIWPEEEKDEEDEENPFDSPSGDSWSGPTEEKDAQE